MSLLRSLFVVAVILAGVSPARATLLTMDEVPFQPVDGLSVSGVSFSFSIGGVSSTDARYHAYGPGSGTTAYMDEPIIEGNARGLLELDFAMPMGKLRFDVALATPVSLSPGFTVQLFDTALASLGTFPIDTDPLVFFSEGRYAYFGTPVARAVIGFAPSAGRFGLDNLRYSVPEPTTLGLFGLGFAVMFAARRRGERL